MATNPLVFGKIKNTKVRLLFFIGFILSMGDAVLAYLESSYLVQYIDGRLVGLFFALAYLLAFIFINIYPRLINRYGNFKTTIVTLTISGLMLLTLVLTSHPWLSIIALSLFLCTRPLIFVNLDIFLEFFSTDSSTGRMRGLYLTILNVGWLISPFLMGYLMERNNSDYTYPFVLATLFTILAIFTIIIFIGNVMDKKEISKPNFSIYRGFLKLWRNRDLRDIFLIAFLLSFFYSWMVIYTPLYLLNLGISWQSIGLIFTFMLLPFIIFEYPAGYIADRYLGEKEIIITGIIIMAIACFIIYSADTVNLLFWSVVLFLSRVGASLVESMRDAYFFKKVDCKDIEQINFFRSSWPLGYLLGPLVAVAILYFTEIKSLYLILGIILVLGLYLPIRIKDTK